MIDLTRLMYDDGASRPEVSEQRTSEVRLMCKGVEYYAILHTEASTCHSRPLRGWWVYSEDYKDKHLEPLMLEKFWRTDRGYGYPGWRDIRTLPANAEDFKASLYLIEYVPVLGVWPAGTPEALDVDE